ncbi:hypothetical protein IHV25_06090 [Phaeovibrio sulfidiphilus]|uniref:Uncharacterized protein n=1 Tax=Phaeovibrio sulfidiphilus TaxID=1220600 RepID=A0A8J7CQT9_9PROT|nr:hypothetical protein [Phaeovibrio sulfidiphilus]MBE1237215.1 hypothetical protein [Phaeovibrio sulfidiphilus]
MTALISNKKYVDLSEPDKLIMALSQGLAGWASFMSFGFRKRTYSEYLFYYPIYEMAIGRRWQIRPQAEIASDTTYSKSKSVDFVFYKSARPKAGLEKCSVALEVKYIKNPASFSGSIESDVEKLSGLSAAHLGVEKYGKPRKYMMIVGKQKHLSEFFDKYPKIELKKKVYGQVRTVLSGRENLASPHGWYALGVGSTSNRFCVCVLTEQDYWNE